jgi:hypothetical protein
MQLPFSLAMTGGTRPVFRCFTFRLSVSTSSVSTVYGRCGVSMIRFRWSTGVLVMRVGSTNPLFLNKKVVRLPLSRHDSFYIQTNDQPPTHHHQQQQQQPVLEDKSPEHKETTIHHKKTLTHVNAIVKRGTHTH